MKKEKRFGFLQNGGSRQKCDEAKIKAASKIPRIANAAKLQANPQTMPTGFLSKLPKPKKPMIITLQIVTIMGKKIPIKIKSSENVKALKKMVSEELGIKPSSQMLVYCNSELKDPQILTQLGIQDQSTIKLVLKMSGGPGPQIQMQSLLQSGDQQTIFLLCRGGEELYVLEVYLCDKDIPKVVAKHYLPVEDAMLDFMASNEFLDMTEFCELDIDLQQLLSIPENIVEGRDETRTPNSFLSDYSGLSRLPSPRPVTSDSLTSLSESLKNLLRNDGDQLYQGIVKGVNSRPATAISLMRISPEAKPLLIIPKSRPASAKEWITGLKSQLETGFEEYNEIELLPAISQSSKIPVSPLKRSALNKDDDLKYFSSDPTHDSVFSTTGTAKIKTTGLIVSSSIVCKNKRRSCYVCNKKLGPAQIFHCKCKSSLCATHRYSDRHSCMFDYKTDAKPGLLKNNPTVKKEKLLRI